MPIALLTIAAAAVVASGSCGIADARYAMRGTPGITARFVEVDSGPDWPNGLAMAIRFTRTGRTYWWLPWDGGTDDRQHLASTTDVTAQGWRPPSLDGPHDRPLGDIDYLATDADYDVIDAAPRRGGSAPAHILLPDLGDVVWHLTPPMQRDGAPKQFLDLIACTPRSR